MTRHSIWSLTLTLLVLSVLPGAGIGSAAAASGCARACLLAVADRYMDRLAANDPKGLPLAANFKASENAKAINLGEGAWSSAASVVQKQMFVDAGAGEVLVYSLLKLKNGKMAAYALRLKLAGKSIEHAEAIYREVDEAAGLALVPADLLYDAAIPAERRMSREALTAAAQRYFTAVESGNVADAHFAFRCDRIDTIRKFDCIAGFSKAKPREVRTFLVDSERGLVASLFFLDIQPAPTITVNLYVVALVKIDGDKIRAVEEISTQVPPDSASPFASK